MPSEGESAKANLSHLIQTRKYVRQRITKVYNNVKDDIDSFSEDDRFMYTDRLESLKNEVKDLDRKIFALNLENGMPEGELQKKIDEDEKYEEKISKTMSKLKFVAQPDPVNPQTHKSLKLPEVALPQFSNEKDQCLDKFFHSFEGIIDKHSLSSYEKFVYLRNQLSKSPRVLIDSLDVKEQCYVKAKELLQKAFGSTLTQKYNAIQRLSEMKLGYNGDPYSYIGDIRTVTNSFKTLKIDVDTVLQYFIWNGLNDRFQSHLTQITNESKPSLAEINDKIFEATERYLKQSDKFKENRNKSNFHKNVDSPPAYNKHLNRGTTVMATNVNSKRMGKFRSCSLCSSDGKSNVDHDLKNCPVYEKPQEKVDKLISLNACTLCSYGNHETKACQFRFSSRCRLCQGFHFTYLCTGKKSESKPGNASVSSVKQETAIGESSSKDAPKNTKGKGEAKNSTVNGIAITEVLRSTVCDDSIILPTFTCDIETTEGNLETVRVLMDGGCQRNFIDEKIAVNNNLKVLKANVGLDIHGFNVSKSVKTKLVLVPLRVGNQNMNIEALCMPEIRTNLNIEGLGKVVDSFLSKGYSLADKYLQEGECEEVGNIGIILGEDGDYVLNTIGRTFGQGIMSTYFDTCLGVILRGNVDRILSNIQYLPYVETIKVNNVCNISSESLTSSIKPEESHDNVQPVLKRENKDYLSIGSSNHYSPF